MREATGRAERWLFLAPDLGYHEHPQVGSPSRHSPFAKGHLESVLAQGYHSGGVGEWGLAGKKDKMVWVRGDLVRRRKQRPLPEREEGTRKQTFKEISFPRRKYVMAQIAARCRGENNPVEGREDSAVGTGDTLGWGELRGPSSAPAYY